MFKKIIEKFKRIFPWFGGFEIICLISFLVSILLPDYLTILFSILFFIFLWGTVYLKRKTTKQFEEENAQISSENIPQQYPPIEDYILPPTSTPIDNIVSTASDPVLCTPEEAAAEEAGYIPHIDLKLEIKKLVPTIKKIPKNKTIIKKPLNRFELLDV